MTGIIWHSPRVGLSTDRDHLAPGLLYVPVAGEWVGREAACAALAEPPEVLDELARTGRVRSWAAPGLQPKYYAADLARYVPPTCLNPGVGSQPRRRGRFKASSGPPAAASG